MYFVRDNIEVCGFYECQDCNQRFLNETIVPYMVCPYCGEQPDMEIGPDDGMPTINESAKLIRVIEGKEEIEKMDALLSLAITGGDYNWIQKVEGLTVKVSPYFLDYSVANFKPAAKVSTLNSQCNLSHASLYFLNIF